MSTTPRLSTHSRTSVSSELEKSMLGWSVRACGLCSGSSWLPGIIRRQPFSVVLSSTASHTVSASIGLSVQYAPSWCHSTGCPSYGGLQM